VIDTPDEEFRLFVERAEPRLRRALVAAYGSEGGREATAEALAYAWEHWERLQEVDNVIGYLYRVGQSRIRPRKDRPLFVRPDHPEPWFEPTLAPALAGLSESQRTAVVLVHGFGWTMREVAECTGVKVTSVQNHLDRGLKKLRTAMKVTCDARPG
jgi:DNA-directed RNA polymerase specialized sigma24 family protein